MGQVATKLLLDLIGALNVHWFFFCCGALVNTPSAFQRVKAFAYE
jgi:hypothetical protein